MPFELRERGINALWPARSGRPDVFPVTVDRADPGDEITDLFGHGLLGKPGHVLASFILYGHRVIELIRYRLPGGRGGRITEQPGLAHQRLHFLAVTR